MARQLLSRGIGLGAAGLTLLLLVHNELGRQLEPPGHFIDLMLPRHLTLPAFLLSLAAAAAVAARGDRGRPRTALLVAAAALAVGVLADRRISFSWESKTLIDSYGPFGATYGGVDAESACAQSGTWSFHIVDGDRSVALFRGIWPLRFTAEALTSRLAVEPCPAGRGRSLNSS